ncbi:hypothetical protein GCM10028799_34680 [Kribbella italica]
MFGRCAPAGSGEGSTPKAADRTTHPVDKQAKARETAPAGKRVRPRADHVFGQIQARVLMKGPGWAPVAVAW